LTAITIKGAVSFQPTRPAKGVRDPLARQGSARIEATRLHGILWNGHEREAVNALALFLDNLPRPHDVLFSREQFLLNSFWFDM
jgi:hypothetical protein